MDYVKHLWNGNASLVFTYWVVAVIGNALFGISDRILDASGFYNVMTEEKLFFIYAFIAASTLYFLFTLVCVWRSATNYKGQGVWAILAKTAMVFGTLRMLGTLVLSFQA
jgi:hypothetical protein